VSLKFIKKKKLMSSNQNSSLNSILKQLVSVLFQIENHQEHQRQNFFCFFFVSTAHEVNLKSAHLYFSHQHKSVLWKNKLEQNESLVVPFFCASHRGGEEEEEHEVSETAIISISIPCEHQKHEQEEETRIVLISILSLLSSSAASTTKFKIISCLTSFSSSPSCFEVVKILRNFFKTALGINKNEIEEEVDDRELKNNFEELVSSSISSIVKTKRTTKSEIVVGIQSNDDQNEQSIPLSKNLEGLCLKLLPIPQLPKMKIVLNASKNSPTMTQFIFSSASEDEMVDEDQKDDELLQNFISKYSTSFSHQESLKSDLKSFLKAKIEMEVKKWMDEINNNELENVRVSLHQRIEAIVLETCHIDLSRKFESASSAQTSGFLRSLISTSSSSLVSREVLHSAEVKKLEEVVVKKILTSGFVKKLTEFIEDIQIVVATSQK
jgi:hypothetical protein